MSSTTELGFRILFWTAVVLVVAAGATWLTLEAGAPAARSPEIFLKLGHSDDVSAVAFSPDSSLLVTGGSDRTVKVWKVSTGELLLSLSGHQSFVLKLTRFRGHFMLLRAKESNDATIPSPLPT